jgi:selenide,water dikinase
VSGATTSRRLVLVGEGAAHLHLLRELARRPVPGSEIVLVAPDDHYHAAMVPGYLQGQYELDELRVDVGQLAHRAGARLVRAGAERVDVAERIVIAGGERIPFDFCSLDVGEESGASIPGAATHAMRLHPMSHAVALRDRLDALIATGDQPLSVIVVGGSTLGVETALALHHRLGASKRAGRITLVDAHAELLGGQTPTFRRLAMDVLREHGIALALGGRVTQVGASSVSLHHGASLPTDLIVWPAGGAPAIVTHSGLPHDDEGRLLVDRSLRAVDGAPVWGVGAGVAVQGAPRIPASDPEPQRQARVLARSLRAAMGKGRPGSYRPHRASLALLNAGGGWALMRWRNLYRHTRWAWRLKNRLDRGFVRRHRAGDEKRAPRS